MGDGRTNIMKVALGHRVQSGPWGGGNRFAAALASALIANGHKVVFDLTDNDIDIILMTDPRARNPSVSFRPGAIFRYLLRQPMALVVHRINECDERKGTWGMNLRLRLANYVADHTVFIGSWLVNLDLWRRESQHSVILNGADPTVFNPLGALGWDGVKPLRLVTHHWGAHAFKGRDVYECLDTLLDQEEWKGSLDFTYIGNLPQGSALHNARVIAPLDGDVLADELRRHHVYLSASLNEPAGMHHIEGAMCGLPLLYRDSGALPEYCSGYGESFTGPGDFPDALRRMIARYKQHRSAILASYDHTAVRMTDAYIELFGYLVARRSEVVSRRRLWRQPATALALAWIKL
ncbi:conserved hypothetical protein [Rhodospirillaceae bacterium LM-1]|nr:conserved hypothetical protein [Rhodospirillaceae bacterium LM-1]